MKKRDFIIVNENTKGLKRVNKPSGFAYRNFQDEIISDKAIIKKIKAIKIPPMWKNVWIASKSNMHIQAFGYDNSGRKQYIYHPDWVKINDKNKFERVHKFGIQISKLRKSVSKHLLIDEWTKEKVAALATSIIDRHYLRVGNKKYSLKNETFGISTLRVNHLSQNEKEFNIIYSAKGSRKRKIRLGSKRLQKMLLDISEIPGEHIFQYVGRGDQLFQMSSTDLNDYIKNYGEGDFTAKDFRTWGATSLAVKYYKKSLKQCKKNKRLKLEPTIVKKVAKRLGNKVATSRDYYIHPYVLQVLREKRLKEFKKAKLPPDIKYKNRLRKHELTTLKILNTI